MTEWRQAREVRKAAEALPNDKADGRAPTRRPQRRRRPQKAKMAATGLGMTLLLGLATAMGISGQATEGASNVAQQEVVSPQPSTQPHTPSPTPIHLKARRVERIVRAAGSAAPVGTSAPVARAVAAPAPASAPVVTTSGSR
jgi:hypothetical protein